MSASEASVAPDVPASDDSPKVDFIVIDGPFKHKEKQWPLANSSNDEIKDWTLRSIPKYYPSSKISKFEFFAEAQDEEESSEESAEEEPEEEDANDGNEDADANETENETQTEPQNAENAETAENAANAANPGGNDNETVIQEPATASDEPEKPPAKEDLDFWTKKGFTNIAKKLLRFIKDQGFATSDREIVFISHGFGGSLLKKALTLACYDPTYAFIPASTRGMVFYTTPHRIQSPETWEDVVFRMLWDMFHTDQLKPWRISGLASVLAEIQAEYLLISESWPTVNVYADPYDYDGPTILSEYNNSFGGYNGLRYGRRRIYSDITKYAENDDFEDMMETIKERVTGGYSDCMQTLTRLAPALPLPMSVRTEAAGVPAKFLEHEAFKSWEESSDSGALLLTGEHGAGKTYFFRSLFYHFRDQEKNQCVSLFTFDCNDARRDSEAEFLLSMIRQNLLISPEVFPTIEDVYKRTVGGGRVAKEDLLLLFRALIRALKEETLVMCINAIDECEDLAAFLGTIKTLMTTNGPKVKLILTTTPKEEVLTSLQGVPTISVDSKVTDVPEYNEFVSRKVTELVKERPVLEEFSSDVLARVATCDSFLQVSLLLTQLRTAPLWSSPKSIRKGINTVEYNLDTIIEKTLKQELPHWALSALSWIAYAVRPLNSNELAVSVALDDGFSDLKELDEILSRDIVGDLQQIFGAMIKVQDGEVRLRHQLAVETITKKYLETPIRTSSEAVSDQWRITSLLLEYLSCSEVTALARTPQPKGVWVSRQRGVYALTRYAAKYWPLHYQRLAGREQHAEYIVKKLKSPTFIETWTALLPDDVRPMDAEQHKLPTKPIHFAADLGFNDVLKIILESYTADEIDSEDLVLALELAAKNGYSDVVEQLLDHGIEGTGAIMRALEEPCRNGLDSVVQALVQTLAEQQPDTLEFPNSLLGESARNGHASVVELLVRAGASVDGKYNETTPLHLAVAEGHDDVVKALLQGGADTNNENEEGSTPLHVACGNADSSIVELLLKAGATTESKNAEGLTALHLATKKEDTPSVKLLLEAKADPSPCSNANVAPLHNAAELGLSKIVELLLQYEADVNTVDEDGNTPLLRSCENGHQEISKLLIEKGADVNGSEKSSYSPLGYAIKDQDEIATLLLEKGADPNKTSYGNQPLTEAARRGSLLLIQLLLEKGAKTVSDEKSGFMPIHAAASGGHYDIVELLIGRGADPNPVDDSGKTPLHLAASGGHVQVVRLLLEHDAKPTAEDDSKATPLHHAARYGHTGVMTLLLEEGASLEAIDEDKRSPLHSACDYGSLASVTLLIERGARPDEDDRWNNTPLILAINVSNESIVDFLLKQNVDTKHRNSDGDTPLHRAAWNGNIPIMEMLTRDADVNIDIRSENDETPLYRAFFYTEAARWILDHGANVNVVSKDGTTPLMFFCRKGDVATSKLVIERQANIHALDQEQSNALHFAASSGELSIVELLLAGGINVNQRAENLQTPLINACRDGYLAIAQALIEKGADLDAEDNHQNTPLHMASYYGRPGIVKVLIEKGAKLDIKDADGDDALMDAVKAGDLDSTKQLLTAGADKETVNKEGNNPLLQAVKDRNMATAMVTLLLEFGVNVNVQAPSKQTPVHVAAAQCDIETLQLLIDAKADLDKVDEQGRTPLLFAAQKNKPEAVTALIKAGANRDATDYQGRNLIHCAVPHYALSDLSNLVSHVLKIRGTRPRQLNAPDADGWSPLHWACKSGESGVIRLLAAAKANPFKRDKKGWTPRQIAIFHNRRDLLPFLKMDGAPEKAGSETSKGDEKKNDAIVAPTPTVEAPPMTLEVRPLKRALTGMEDDASTDGGGAENDFKTGQEHYAYCDSCYVYIWGIRFKCQDCPDFDFCFKCMWRAKHIHDPEHKFKRIGSGPDQGPYSFKMDEDEEKELAEKEAKTKAGGEAVEGEAVEKKEGE